MGLSSYEKKELLDKGLNLKLKNLKFNSYSSEKEVPIVTNFIDFSHISHFFDIFYVFFFIVFFMFFFIFFHFLSFFHFFIFFHFFHFFLFIHIFYQIIMSPTLFRLDDPSLIITKDQFEVVWDWLPEHSKNKSPKKVFSSEKDGCSLNYLYTFCQNFIENSMIFLVKTDTDSVFS